MIRPRWRYHVAYIYQGRSDHVGEAVIALFQPYGVRLAQRVRAKLAAQLGVSPDWIALIGVTPLGEPKGALAARGRVPRS